MRLVTIDNGNTHPSVAFFDEGILTSVIPLAQYVPEESDFVLIASVGRTLKMKASFDLGTRRTKTHFFEMPVDYAETLGADRLVAGYFTFKQIAEEEKILVVDAGTFMTCDLIEKSGFKGGFIFPGIGRFLKSYADSAKLPLLTKDLLFKGHPSELPHTTNEAILMATETYLKSSIEEVVRKTSPSKILFTGGNGADIQKLISSKVPSEVHPHLIHSALATIYQTHLAPA